MTEMGTTGGVGSMRSFMRKKKEYRKASIHKFEEKIIFVVIIKLGSIK